MELSMEYNVIPMAVALRCGYPSNLMGIVLPAIIRDMLKITNGKQSGRKVEFLKELI